MINFKELDQIEEQEYRLWAHDKDNFDPKTDKINSCWHPIVKDECRIISSAINTSSVSRNCYINRPVDVDTVTFEEKLKTLLDQYGSHNMDIATFNNQIP